MKSQLNDNLQSLRVQKIIQAQQSSEKDDDHYFDQNPVELATVLAKVLAEVLLSSNQID